MTIWAGQILYCFGFLVWPLNAKTFWPDNLSRVLPEIWQWFEANRMCNGPCRARSMQKFVIRMNWPFGLWPKSCSGSVGPLGYRPTIRNTELRPWKKDIWITKLSNYTVTTRKHASNAWTRFHFGALSAMIGLWCLIYKPTPFRLLVTYNSYIVDWISRNSEAKSWSLRTIFWFSPNGHSGPNGHKTL